MRKCSGYFTVAILLLFSCLFIQPSLGLLQTSKKISSFGSISVSSPQFRIIFESDLNSEDDLHASEWRKGNHWLQNPSDYCKVTITSENKPHSSPACGKMELLKPSMGDQYRRLVARVVYDKSIKELYAFSWHYFPVDFPRHMGSICAMKEEKHDEQGKYVDHTAWRLYGRQKTPDGKGNYLRVHEYHNPQEEHDLDAVAPLGEWFRTGIHIVRDRNNGLIEFFVNGEKIFSKSGVNTQWYDDSFITHFSAHFLYVGTDDPPCYNYFDDVVLSDSWIPLNYVPS